MTSINIDLHDIILLKISKSKKRIFKPNGKEYYTTDIEFESKDCTTSNIITFYSDKPLN